MLSSTYNQTGFDEALVCKESLDLDLPNANHVKIYRLPVANSMFDFTRIKDLIANNIKNYVFSRKEIKEANLNDTGDALYHKALQKFREIKNDKDNGNGAEFGEIMLYLFMEHDLRAPKIFSKMELKTNRNDYVKGADGVFLHQYAKNNFSFFDLVIGESKCENRLTTAIDEAFDSMESRIKDCDFEVELIDENIFKESFDEDEIKEIIKIIIPSNDIKENVIVNKAFGVFIGYSIGIDLSKVPAENVLMLIEEKMKKDIEKVVEKFKENISKKKLTNYSFYVYLLPLNIAKKDRKDLMKYIIG